MAKARANVRDAAKYDLEPTVEELTPEDVHEAAEIIAKHDLHIDLEGWPAEFDGSRAELVRAFHISNLNQTRMAEVTGCSVSDLVDIAAEAAS